LQSSKNGFYSDSTKSILQHLLHVNPKKLHTNKKKVTEAFQKNWHLKKKLPDDDDE
jgi:hypothetical protein